MDFLKHFTEKLKEAFDAFRKDPIQSFRVKLRRVRAEQIRNLLSDPDAMDLAVFNRDIWPAESETLHRTESVTGLSFKDTLAPDRAAQLEQWLDAGELEFHGNYVWGSGASVFGAKSKDTEEEKTNLIRQAVRVLNDSTLTPSQKVEGILKIPGFGPNIGTGLVMLFHPDEFAIYNKQSKGALSLLGHRTEPLGEFQKSVRSLRDRLGATDYLELDWFLYLVNQEQIKIGRPPKFWWVNQGQRYEIERNEGSISAPTQAKDGKVLYHWENVSRICKGDIVLSYFNRRVVAVSKAVSQPTIERPAAGDSRDARKLHRVGLSFRDVSDPVALDMIPKELRIAEGGPFNKNGGVKQGYLFELSNEFIKALAEAAPDLYALVRSVLQGDHPNSTTNKILSTFLTLLASAKGLDDQQAAANWLMQHEWGEILVSRMDFYTGLGAILRKDPGDVKGFTDCLAGDNSTVLSGSVILRICIRSFLENPQAPGMLRDFLGDCSSPPTAEDVTQFIDRLVECAFKKKDGGAVTADAALFCSAILSAVFPKHFVDYRQGRWKDFAEMLELGAFPKASPYGEQLIWAGKAAGNLTATETFKMYFTDVEPYWIAAGLAYLLTKDEELKAMVQQARNGDPKPPQLPKVAKNLILYGPPGTGKTYISIQKAVEICDGTAPNDRKALVQRFGKLQDDGRIAFVTFHQSYGYEEFVEGIQPVLSEDAGADLGSTQAGVVYECRDGVFKRICSLAKGIVSTAKGGSDLDIEGVRVWKMSLGNTRDPSQAYIYDDCIENSYILLGYGDGLDFTGCDDREAVKAKLRSESPDIKNTDYNITSVNAFKNEMAVGDLVIVSDGNAKFRAIGRVTGEYEFYRSEEYGQKRAVEWLLVCDESLPREKIITKAFSQMTLYEPRPSALKMDALRELLSGQEQASPANHVLIVDEINRGNISKILGELITLLEPDKRLGGENELKVTLPYSRDVFGVPSNLYIIGTMNTADRSIAFMDTALRRRFEFQEMMPDLSVIRNNVGEGGSIAGVNVAALLDKINKRIELLYDRDHQIGHSYLMKADSLKDLRDTFLANVIPLLQEYFYGDWEKRCIVLGCPYSPETGRPITVNQHPIITAERLNAAELPGVNDDYENSLRYVVNPSFVNAGEDALAPFFSGITASGKQNPEPVEESQE
ncbi:MAG: AAA family ATPase [Phycisphaerae bacterium]|nr:AAA family ATPase [Phycisphaerae bacterium]